MNFYCRLSLKSVALYSFIFIAQICLSPFLLYGATYYVSPDGGGSTCSADSRCLFTTAFGKLKGGDTVVIGDGTYSNQIKNVPSGNLAEYTVIKAENDGRAIISYSADFPLRLGSSYVSIEGIKFMNNAVDAAADVAFITGGYNKILRCAFVSNPTSTNNNKVNVTVAGKYNLLEDCWSWGGGRYKFKTNGLLSEDTGHHNIFRRCVARHDREWSGSNPQAAFINYMGGYNLFQNCIVIDSDQISYYQGLYRGAWFLEKGQQGHEVRIEGSIILKTSGGIYDSSSMDYAGTDFLHGNVYLADLIVWDSGQGFQTYYNFAGRIMSLDHGTLGSPSKLGGDDYPGWAFHPGNSRSDGAIATNSIFYNWNSRLTAVKTSGAIANAGGANDFNSFYGNSINVLNAGTGIHNIAKVNPVSESLKYLPRIEKNTPLKGAGSGGSDIGATVLYRIGVSGTLYGQTGYDALTSEPLWPWPNEARIKSDMSSYPSNWPEDNKPDPVRGFTAGSSKDGSPQTLTKYIWEYLGHQIPPEIYGVAQISSRTK